LEKPTAKSLPSSSRYFLDEAGEVLGGKLQVLLVEHPFRQPAEKAAHPVLEDLVPRAQEVGPRK